ncbi:MAG: aminodeoxychorismate lyase, partial [Gammaproteobacteria bacterium]|nr:aminodeoxychorismate lyase [Gammaproteobacteria bacterium]
MNNILINGEFDNLISVNDRAFQYGDGVFETIACKNNKLIFWDEHMDRLNNACKVLRLNLIDESIWIDDIKKLVSSNQNDLAIKLIYSRGNGQRGYRLPAAPEPVRVVMSAPLPLYSDEFYATGVKLIVCNTPASINSRLAGIKHINKLENVLARNEWFDPDIFEGLMLDDYGNVIEGTMTNVFAIKNNSLYTPILKRSGVNGIIRQKVIQLAKNNNIVTQQIEIKLEKLLEMDELFITNSFIGITPVYQLQNKIFPA